MKLRRAGVLPGGRVRVAAEQVPQIGRSGSGLGQRRRGALEIIDDDRAQRRAVGAVEKAGLRGLRHELVGGPGGIAEQVVDNGVVLAPCQPAHRRSFQVRERAVQGGRGSAPDASRGNHRPTAAAGPLRQPCRARPSRARSARLFESVRCNPTTAKRQAAPRGSFRELSAKKVRVQSRSWLLLVARGSLTHRRHPQGQQRSSPPLLPGPSCFVTKMRPGQRNFCAGATRRFDRDLTGWPRGNCFVNLISRGLSSLALAESLIHGVRFRQTSGL